LGFIRRKHRPGHLWYTNHLNHSYDAIVIGSGPNGLTAAILLARAGLKVYVFEAQDTAGGGTRSEELTEPGFVHDVCSAVHPLAVGSPAFESFPLAEHGLEWIHPPAPLAHPLDDGSAVLMHRSVDETAAELGVDRDAYKKLMAPLAQRWDTLGAEFLQPLHFPKHPLQLGGFGLKAIRSAEGFARNRFRSEAARALFAGLAAHSILPLEKPVTAAFGLVFAMTAHAVGWPIPRGGSQSIANALCSYLSTLGGEVVTGRRVDNVDEFTGARAIVCDVTPRQLLKLAGHRFSRPYARRLEKYRYGPGVFKVDWALREPIPWKAAACAQAATVHLGGGLEDIAASERAPWRNEIAGRPFVLLAQPSLFDPTRAPDGKHTAWGYCHVPNGSREDVTDRIESQVERFAPGFRRTILARQVFDTVAMERHNANLVGGDINGGSQDLAQQFLRPTRRLYRTSARGIYICSASTPPGGGVHGLCGYYAAQAVLKDLG
jgi:phytoene dehydrogenase-like protein